MLPSAEERQEQPGLEGQAEDARGQPWLHCHAAPQRCQPTACAGCAGSRACTGASERGSCWPAPASRLSWSLLRSRRPTCPTACGPTHPSWCCAVLHAVLLPGPPINVMLDVLCAPAAVSWPCHVCLATESCLPHRLAAVHDLGISPGAGPRQEPGSAGRHQPQAHKVSLPDVQAGC